MQHLLLTLDAPLMSFGGPAVDKYGGTEAFPAASMLTGLVANALGWRHGDFDQLQRLQARLRFAARRDRAGERLRDYQTADLRQPFLRNDCAWTTWGRLDKRGGAGGGATTTIRERMYLADAVYTLALRLEPADEVPTLRDVQQAILRPARPLYLGRKPCLPAASLNPRLTDADSVSDALQREARHPRGDAGALAVWRPATRAELLGEPTRLIPTTDERDWRNQIHVGQRMLVRDDLQPGDQP